jgi:hypothetical protein
MGHKFKPCSKLICFPAFEQLSICFEDLKESSIERKASSSSANLAGL